MRCPCLARLSCQARPFGLPDDVLPALGAAGVTDEQIDQMLVGNPRAILAPRIGH